MKTPALLMLTALVALAHWLLLAPGPGTLTHLTHLAQITGLMAPTEADPGFGAGLQASAARAPVHAFQTRRIESSPPLSAQVLQAVHVEPSSVTGKPGMSNALAQGESRKKPPPEVAQVPTPRLGETRTPTPTYVDAKVPTGAMTNATDATDAQAAEDLAASAALPSTTNASAQATTAAPQSREDGSPTHPTPPLAAQLAAQVRLPQPARLDYDIIGQSRGLGYRASGVLDWQQDGSRYDARLVASVFLWGQRVLTSQGEITTDGLAPKRFSDKARSEQAAHFEADKGKITFSANTPDAPWHRGAQDRLSVFFQLAGMLAGQPERLTSGTHIPVYTVSARYADTWAFSVDDIENLSLPAGNIPAVKLTRQHRLEHDPLVEVWFAPSLSYWPVRIKLTQRNGDFVDQQLASVPKP